MSIRLVVASRAHRPARWGSTTPLTIRSYSLIVVSSMRPSPRRNDNHSSANPEWDPTLPSTMFLRRASLNPGRAPLQTSWGPFPGSARRSRASRWPEPGVVTRTAGRGETSGDQEIGGGSR